MQLEPINELSKKHTDELSKYTYFLLATSATAITYALQKLEGLKFSLSLFPVIIAILAWVVSFYYGHKHLCVLKDHIAVNNYCLTRD